MQLSQNYIWIADKSSYHYIGYIVPSVKELVESFEWF